MSFCLNVLKVLVLIAKVPTKTMTDFVFRTENNVLYSKYRIECISSAFARAQKCFLFPILSVLSLMGGHA